MRARHAKAGGGAGGRERGFPGAQARLPSSSASGARRSCGFSRALHRGLAGAPGRLRSPEGQPVGGQAVGGERRPVRRRRSAEAPAGRRGRKPPSPCLRSSPRPRASGPGAPRAAPTAERPPPRAGKRRPLGEPGAGARRAASRAGARSRRAASARPRWAGRGAQARGGARERTGSWARGRSRRGEDPQPRPRCPSRAASSQARGGSGGTRRACRNHPRPPPRARHAAVSREGRAAARMPVPRSGQGAKAPLSVRGRSQRRGFARRRERLPPPPPRRVSPGTAAQSANESPPPPRLVIVISSVFLCTSPIYTAVVVLARGLIACFCISCVADDVLENLFP